MEGGDVLCIDEGRDCVAVCCSVLHRVLQCVLQRLADEGPGEQINGGVEEGEVVCIDGNRDVCCSACCSVLQVRAWERALHHSASQCNALQHIATHCNTLQYAAA